MNITGHARKQCEDRGIPVDAVLTVVSSKLAEHGYCGEDAAVYAGRTTDRGALIGSNGDQVWAIIREGRVHTVMLRRSDQPSTPQALRVRRVYGRRAA